MTAVVGEGRAKVVSAVPVGIPREAVVGTVERQTELAGGMEWRRQSHKGGGENPARQKGKDRGAMGA